MFERPLCTQMGMSVRSWERHTWTSGESLGHWAIKLQVTPTVRREGKRFEKESLENSKVLSFPRALEYYKAWTLGKSNQMSRRNEQTQKTWTRFLTFKRPLCLHIMYYSTHGSPHASSRKLWGGGKGKLPRATSPARGPWQLSIHLLRPECGFILHTSSHHFFRGRCGGTRFQRGQNWNGSLSLLQPADTTLKYNSKRPSTQWWKTVINWPDRMYNRE